jgi:hypothetical protein
MTPLLRRLDPEPVMGRVDGGSYPYDSLSGRASDAGR